jgi:hypothetical protein
MRFINHCLEDSEPNVRCVRVLGVYKRLGLIEMVYIRAYISGLYKRLVLKVRVEGKGVRMLR